MSINQCPFYGEERKFKPSREVQDSRQGVLGGVVEIRWCDHAKHPTRASEAMVRSAAIMSHGVTCGGNIAQCTIPLAQRST